MYKVAIMVGILMILTSCSGISSQIPYEPFTVEVIYLKVHVMPDKSKFPPGCRQWNNNGGCAAYTDIWVVGKMRSDGEVDISHEVLGHELAHVLRWQRNGRIANPDRK